MKKVYDDLIVINLYKNSNATSERLWNPTVKYWAGHFHDD